MHEVNWGIIGCGDVTEKKSGPAFSIAPHSHLIAVMRRDAQKAQDYAKRHNISKWYSDADELISDKDINAIYIATPPLWHAEYAIKAMLAGKPVYVEKPMAASYDDCLQMITISRQTSVPLFVAYYRRSLPYFIKVKELIELDLIGDLLLVTCKLFSSPRANDYQKPNLAWRVLPEIAGGGYFYDMGCHTLDVLDFIFGPINEVSGYSGNKSGLYPAEDVVAASFKFQNGLHGTGSWSFTADVSAKCDIVEIIGSKGRILFSTFEFTPIVLENNSTRKVFQPLNPEHIQQCMINDVVGELRGTAKSPSTGISAARTNHVMDIILNKISIKQKS